MRYDDSTIGTVLTRREIIGLAGAAGIAWLGRGANAFAATTGCVVRPAQTEGPYFVDRMLERSDLRLDPSDGSLQPGVTLAITMIVTQMADGTCVPLPDAQVDLWHCDYRGVYSGVNDPAFNTVGQKFLRGFQRTDAAGRATFTTIYPGWYPGRTVHIHFKIRSSAVLRPGFEFTSQFYFEDALSDRIFAADPYAARGPRNVNNLQDRIFRRDGARLMLPIEPARGGYSGTFDIALEDVVGAGA